MGVYIHIRAHFYTYSYIHAQMAGETVRTRRHTIANTKPITCHHCTYTTIRAEYRYSRYNPTAHTRGNTYTAPYRHYTTTVVTNTDTNTNTYTDTMQLQQIRPTQPTHGDTYTTPYRHLHYHGCHKHETPIQTQMSPTLSNTPVQTQYNPDRHSSHSPPTANTHFRHHVATTQPQLSQTPIQIQCHHPCTTQIYKHDAAKT